MSKRDKTNVSQIKHGPVKKILIKHMDSVGDGSGSITANGDYSAAVQKFRFAPEEDEAVRIARMIIEIEDTSGFQAEEYGNLGDPLSNGIILQTATNGGEQVIDLMDSDPIKTNAQWGGLCYDVDLKTWGAGNEVLLVRWSFDKCGTPLRLDGDKQDSLELLLNDDFSGLLGHHFILQGFYE